MWYPFTPQDIGRVIRAARRECGWTQQQFAQSVGVGQPTVSELERGLNWPGIPTLVRYAQALGCFFRIQFQLVRQDTLEPVVLGPNSELHEANPTIWNGRYSRFYTNRRIHIPDDLVVRRVSTAYGRQLAAAIAARSS